MRAKKEIIDFLDLFNLETNDKIDCSLLDPEGKHPMKTVFLEICFINRIKSDQVHRYYKHLKKRRNDIERVINSHFNMIKDALIDK